MSDSVKGIFKILIKVPVIIAISYLIFNLFAFSVSYFKLLGVSYSVMQIAMENNYIPDNEIQTITKDPSSNPSGKFLQYNYNTNLLSDVKIVCDTSGHEADSLVNNTRKQYGNNINVGVVGTYTWLVPFRRSVEGYKGEAAGKYGNEGTSGELTRNKTEIKIVYNVPGLKYYPDLTK